MKKKTKRKARARKPKVESHVYAVLTVLVVVAWSAVAYNLLK